MTRSKSLYLKKTEGVAKFRLIETTEAWKQDVSTFLWRNHLGSSLAICDLEKALKLKGGIVWGSVWFQATIRHAALAAAMETWLAFGWLPKQSLWRPLLLRLLFGSSPTYGSHRVLQHKSTPQLRRPNPAPNVRRRRRAAWRATAEQQKLGRRHTCCGKLWPRTKRSLSIQKVTTDADKTETCEHCWCSEQW